MTEQREVSINNAKIGKIVDFIGEGKDLAEFAGNGIDSWKKEYEFIDMYSYGIPEDILEQFVV